MAAVIPRMKIIIVTQKEVRGGQLSIQHVSEAARTSSSWTIVHVHGFLHELLSDQYDLILL